MSEGHFLKVLLVDICGCVLGSWHIKNACDLSPMVMDSPPVHDRDPHRCICKRFHLVWPHVVASFFFHKHGSLPFEEDTPPHQQGNSSREYFPFTLCHRFSHWVLRRGPKLPLILAVCLFFLHPLD